MTAPDFLAELQPDTRKLQRLLRIWRETGAGIGPDPAMGRQAASDAVDLIDGLRAQLHAARLQVTDELRQHDQAVERRVTELRARPDATRGRPAAMAREHRRLVDGAGPEGPH